MDIPLEGDDAFPDAFVPRSPPGAVYVTFPGMPGNKLFPSIALGCKFLPLTSLAEGGAFEDFPLYKTLEIELYALLKELRLSVCVGSNSDALDAAPIPGD